MKIKIEKMILILLLATTFAAQAGDFNKGGRTAFQFTKIGIGARQVAMGEACVAVVRDVNAIFWNPANISGIRRMEASFTYTRWLAELNYFAGAIGVRLKGIGIVGLSAASLDYGELKESLAISPSGGNDTRTGNSFTGGDIMLGLTFTREFTDRLAIGVSLKYLREELFVYDTDLLAFDVGTYYHTGFKGIRLAMGAQNFGAKSVKWLEESDREEGYDLPLVYKIGVAMDLIRHSNSFFNLGNPHYLQISFDAINTNDYGERYHMGAEYWFNDLIALRSGYKFNYEEGNLSLGFGLKTGIAGKRIQVDYAFVNYDVLTSPHRFTVAFAF